MISAGELRDVIKIQQPIRVQTDSGGFTTTYVDIISKTYAKVVEERSNGVVTASQEDIINYLHFKIRYRPNNFIENGYRLVWRGFNFTINNIKVDTLRTEINIFVNAEIETSER